MRIGIIGMGWVGSSVAISTLQAGVPTELLLADLRAELAEGEAMDLVQGSGFYPTASVRVADLEEMRDADAVVLTAGRGGRPEQSRLDLVRENAAIVRDIAARLAGARGLLVVLTNPVDIMVQVAVEASGLPASRVLGTGTMLDTARLRQILGRELALEARSIHAQVIGEHGDSSVPVFSGARVGGVPLRRWPGWSARREQALAQEVRGAAYEIIRRKGATNHAIGLVTAALLRWALRGERRVLTVSARQQGALGLEGVALSLPAVIGRGGVERILEPELDAPELEALRRSAALLREVGASVL